MPLLRRATCAALAAACVLLAGSAQAQRTEFATPLATPPPAFTPPPAGAPAIPTLNAPNATFGGTIQPVAPGFDPYADPAAQAAAGYQPGAMTQQATTGGDGYLFLRPDGSLGEWPRFLQQARFRYTWLDGNGGYDNGLGMNIAEIDGTFVLPFPYSQNAPLLITPGFAVDWTQGPITSTTGADLPPQMYEAYIDAAWRPKFGPRFGADLGFRTGVYSDFSYFNNFSMRYIGRGYGTYTWSPHLELKAGVVYIDRLRMKLLPAGGLIWNPDPDTRFEILFPNPKLAIRMTTFGNVDVWGYVAGEYGGGSWTITRDSTNPFLPPSHDEVEYDDIKIISGIEWTGKLNLKGFVEGGFVWNRKLNYRSDIGNLDLRNTIMVRGGIAF